MTFVIIMRVERPLLSQTMRSSVCMLPLTNLAAYLQLSLLLHIPRLMGYHKTVLIPHHVVTPTQRIQSAPYNLQSLGVEAMGRSQPRHSGWDSLSGDLQRMARSAVTELARRHEEGGCVQSLGFTQCELPARWFWCLRCHATLEESNT